MNVYVYDTGTQNSNLYDRYRYYCTSLSTEQLGLYAEGWPYKLHILCNIAYFKHNLKPTIAQLLIFANFVIVFGVYDLHFVVKWGNCRTNLKNVENFRLSLLL